MTANITKLSESALKRGDPESREALAEKTVLLVLGMHRCGTSAATRVMSLLGADLPSNLMLPKADNNEAGFWESLDTYKLNDKILESAGSRWDDWRRFNPDWVRSPKAREYKGQALEILEKEFGKSPLFVLKDPRICRLLPFWLEVFREFDSEVKCLLPLRNPLEVAASLKERDGFSPAKSYMLWLRHVLDAEKATRKTPRVFFAYDDLLMDWRDTVVRVSDRLDLSWPRKAAIAEVEIDRFLDHRHRHHSIGKADIDHRPEVAGWVRKASKALATLTENPHAKKTLRHLDSIRGEFNRASDALGAVLLAEEIARKEAEQMVSEVEVRSNQLSDQLDQRNKKVAELEEKARNHDEIIKKLREDVADRDQRTQALEHRTEEQNAAMEVLKQAATNQNTQIEKLNRQIIDQEKALSKLGSVLAERETRIAELDRLLLDQKTMLAERETCIAELDRLLLDQKNMSRDLRSEISNGDKRFAELKRRSTEQEVRITALQNENRVKTQENTKLSFLESQVSALHSKNDVLVSKVRGAERLSSTSLIRLNAAQTVSRRNSLSGDSDPNANLHSQPGEQVWYPPRNCCGSKLSLRERIRLQKKAKRLLASRLFDEDWYVLTYPNVVLNGDDPLWFWLIRGWRDLQNPNPFFDMRWYRKQNPDVASAGVNPLFHFLEHGAAELRDPGPLFSCRWYLHDNPDVEAAGVNPLVHYMKFGLSEGRKPNPLFDPNWYREQNPTLAGDGVDLLRNYLTNDGNEVQNPSPLLHGAWYLNEYPDVSRSGMNPLIHYLRHGRFEGRKPNSLFDGGWYLKNHSDVRHAGLDPLEHYLMFGAKEGRDPSPLFDTDWYVSQNPEVVSLNVNPLEHYLSAWLTSGDAAPPMPVSRIEPSQLSVGKAEFPDKPADLFGLRKPSPQLPIFPGKKASLAGQKNMLLCAHAANGQLFGGERSFLDLLEMLAEIRINVHVVVPKNNPDYLAKILELAVEVVHVPYKYWSAGEEMNATTVAALTAYMMQRDIDLVHVNTIVVREPLFAARKLGIPSITHVRESIVADRWMSEMLGVSEQEIIQEVISAADYVIANSKRTAAEFNKEGATFVVPNNFDLTRLDLENKIDPDEIKVGLISSNIPKKGIEDFVRLAKACSTEIPNLFFYLIGPKNQHLGDLIARQAAGGLSENLRFVDYQKTPEEALAHVNIVMSLSHFAESFGRTVAEGLAARRPVVVYDLGAAQDLVQSGESGFVIPFPEWEEAIPFLQMLARDPRKIQAMGEQGRAFIEQNYSRQVGIDSLAKAYERIFTASALVAADSEALGRRIFPARIMRNERLEKVANLRLAYFCWHFPVPSETFVLNELRLLVAQGVDVAVYCKQTPYPDFKPDFDIRWERVADVDDLAHRLVESKRTFVHAHFTYPTVTNMVWPACEKSGLPFTFIAHAQDIFKYENDRKNRIAEIVSSPLCRAVFTLGTFHRKFLAERGVPLNKIVINPNAIDTNRFPFQPPKPREGRSLLRVCAVHRLTRKKGLHNLVGAASQLKNDSIEFNIYGYGDEEEPLQALIKEHGLANVKLCGPLKTTAEVVDVLREHDLFASPSIRTDDGDMDGIPTAVVESMAVGTPVIVTDVASIPDLVQDQVTGIVVAPDSPQDLARGVTRFFTLDDEAVSSLALNARRAVEARHDVRRLTSTLKRVWSVDRVDIVIVSWNNIDELKEVIARVFENTKTPFHLTICDNKSGLEVRCFLSDLQERFDNVTIVFNDVNRFVGPGTNVAIEQGRGKYIIYLCGKEGFSVAEGWEDAMIAFMDENPGVGIAGTLGHSPSYLTGSAFADGISEFQNFRNKGFAEKNPDRTFFHVQGGLFILRREMVDAIGGFNESVPHAYTDVEYSFYAESQGWGLGNIPSVLALYNKTAPDIWSRVHEGIKVLHPPRLRDLELLDRIARRSTSFCNVCGWSGSEFALSDGVRSCPDCGSNPEHRTLYRFIAESIFPYRRLPALWINPHQCLKEFWEKSFQGPQLSEDEFVRILDRRGKLDNSQGSLHLIVADLLENRPEPIAAILGEFRRLIKKNGRVLLFPDVSVHSASRLSDLLLSTGFEVEDHKLYASSVVGYSLRRLWVLAPKNSEFGFH